MKQATKKPVTINFVEWTGYNLSEVIKFTGQNVSVRDLSWGEYEDLVGREGLKIFATEGPMMANVGDFIIQGVGGGFYPCNPDVFALTYNVIE